jgi:hypothetical protein
MQITNPSRLIVSDFIACGILALAIGLATSLVLAGAVLLVAGQ